VDDGQDAGRHGGVAAGRGGAAAGEARVELDASGAHGNPMGTVQGGIRAGRISARARVKNAGRTLGLIECDVMDGSDKLVAHAATSSI
jgi:acyl-coenzyme A thioesterase PaaI-like protein